jgi:predicted nucleic acid-binding protein
MNIVDSSGWLEYFGNGDNADFFSPIINNYDELLVPAITITEVFKRVYHQRGEESALEAIAYMFFGRIIDITGEIALDAAYLGLKHKLPIADSLILSSARTYNSTLYTQDSDFEGLDDVVFIRKIRKV